ncbi:MAG: carbohydrate ABC transporter permease [Chloroflexia bacterium]|jgi:multiple sugar transport system permease protein|nr:carbohydrate ABC transporter permease [Chloroflexia bacterium]
MANVTLAHTSERAGSALLSRIISRSLAHGTLLILGILFFIPFFWMITSSFKINSQLSAFPIVWVPNPVTFEHYTMGLQQVPFARWILNTLVVCAFSVLGTVISCSMVAYGLSRIDWAWRKPLFALLLATTMIPDQVTFIPLFITFRWLGWVNTYLPLTVPSFFANAFFVFLLRQFFMTIPRELSEAAKVDGASEITIFTRVILPLARPALATVGLFQFLASWGDFFGPLIYLSRTEQYTVSLGLTFFQGEYTSEFGSLMAASTVMLLPVVVLFFFTQRTFIQGITLTGIKG